eukprot:TRINITY_DN9146_c0_g1_i1.p1 TRINITY_DN9146_c0_g1~~TRINITY_DN9146_c0_g1_i1.p1  ORF type:complete len:335 (+),score=76.55 TRINITY_DN9146_c0_g1_i1:29-1033(+)
MNGALKLSRLLQQHSAICTITRAVPWFPKSTGRASAFIHQLRDPLHGPLAKDDPLRSSFRKEAKRTLILETVPEHVKLNRLTDSDSGIVELILNRPEAKNAIGNTMLTSLQCKLEDLNVDSTAHVILLHSCVPKIFCSGADLKERRKMNESEVKHFVNALRSTFSLLEGLSVPTIAVVEGAALGGGTELALSCDLRVCGSESIFALPETGLAIIPGAGGTQRLPRLIGRSQAKELIFTGRKVYGPEASSLGLVDHCVSAGEAYSKALDIAREIIQKGPLAVKMAKLAINQGCEVDMVSGMFIEESCYMELLNSKDRLEGLAAFAEKRKPNYTGE